MPPAPVRFVILSQPRTGSTLICSLLNSVPSIRVLVEPINPTGHRHHMQPVPGNLVPDQLVHTQPVRAIRALHAVEPPSQWLATRKQATIAAGFKIMCHQLRALRREQAVWEHFRDDSVKIILVFRHNILMQYVSDLIVQATRQSTCWDGQVRTARVTVPIQTLSRNLHRIVREKHYLLRKVEQYQLESKRLRYENFKDDVLPVARVATWLIGEQPTLSTRLSKQNPDRLQDRVVNYQELIAEVRRLNMEHLLDAG